jgi:hypothetical protein
MIRVITLVISILLLLFVAPAMAACPTATCYADPAGSGTDCTTGTPCDIEYAIETKASAGDTVIAKTGTYTGMGSLAVSDANLTIEADTGATVWLDGENSFSGGQMFYVTASGVTFDGINIKRVRAGGVEKYGIYFNEADDGTVKNLTIDEISQSCILAIESDGGTIQDSTFTQCDYDRNGGAVTIQRDSENWTVQRNVIASAVAPNQGLAFVANQGGHLIEKNSIYDTYRGVYFNWAGAGNVLRYNLIYCSAAGYAANQCTTRITFINENAGITGSRDCDDLYYTAAYWTNVTMYGNMTAGGDVQLSLNDEKCVLGDPVINDIPESVVTAYHNTFMAPDNTAKNTVYVRSGDYSGSIYKNNVFKKGTAAVADIYGGGTWENNCWSELEANVDSDARNPGTNDIYDAGFCGMTKTSGWGSLGVGAVTGTEFSLTSDSPAINTALPITGYNNRIYFSDFTKSPIRVSTADVADMPFGTGEGPDIGAWEYIFNAGK